MHASSAEGVEGAACDRAVRSHHRRAHLMRVRVRVRVRARARVILGLGLGLGGEGGG